MSAHTPGPWEKRAGESLDICIMSKSKERYGAIVAYAAGMGGPDASFYPEPEANARLIAAAPDLLAALKQVEWSGEHYGSQCCCCCSAYKELEAHDKDCELANAIDKADPEFKKSIMP